MFSVNMVDYLMFSLLLSTLIFCAVLTFCGRLMPRPLIMFKDDFYNCTIILIWPDLAHVSIQLTLAPQLTTQTINN